MTDGSHLDIIIFSMIMIIHYDKYHPNMCIDPIISFMDRFMGEAKYVFKHQHHHEQVNEGTVVRLNRWF